MTSDERADAGLDVHTPDGERLVRGQRLTFREARPWVRRASTLLGVRRCFTPVAWAEGGDRVDLAARFRRSEGGDCDTSGDVLLFQLDDGRRAVVMEDLSWSIAISGSGGRWGR